MIAFLLEILFKLLLIYGIVKTVMWLSDADNRERFANRVGVFVDAANSGGRSSGGDGDSCGGSDSAGGSCGGGGGGD